ncbi:MAG: TetR/AcrR family transcriptional regulator [Bacillota bacterium]
MAGDDKRKSIIDAGISVFSRLGFHGAKMEDIAQEARVAKGTVYLYFPSKEVLLEEIYRHALGTYFEGLVERSAKDSAPAEKLYDMALFTLTFAGENRESARFILEAATGMREEFKVWLFTLRARWIDLTCLIIQEAMKRGEARPDLDALAAAHMYVGALNSLVSSRLWGNRTVSAAADAATLCALFWRGVGVAG